MTPGAILTLGLGAYSDINHLVTLGYGTGAEAPPEPPEPPAPAPAAQERPAGGFFPGRRRREEDVRRGRELVGIPQAVAEVIEDVAARQAAALEQDAQKRYEELTRELALRDIEYRTGYLEAMNIQRERLIGQEIARRIRQMQDEKDVLALLALLAEVVD